MKNFVFFRFRVFVIAFIFFATKDTNITDKGLNNLISDYSKK